MSAVKVLSAMPVRSRSHSPGRIVAVSTWQRSAAHHGGTSINAAHTCRQLFAS
jgi:hypothetical protein